MRLIQFCSSVDKRVIFINPHYVVCVAQWKDTPEGCVQLTGMTPDLDFIVRGELRDIIARLMYSGVTGGDNNANSRDKD